MNRVTGIGSIFLKSDDPEKRGTVIILRWDQEPRKEMKLMYKYEIILYWGEEDQAFIAEVPELPGCMAHGDTQEAALSHAREAIQLWIDTAQEFGDPVPQPKGRRLMLT